jgi:hypothetical protein
MYLPSPFGLIRKLAVQHVIRSGFSMEGHRQSSEQKVALPGRSMFLIAWCFFAIATAIGFALRIHTLSPIAGLNYSFLLHTHSHVAFLGWIYNAFFALALAFFISPEKRAGFRWLFVGTQVATVGMMLTFPFQGYARESIVFSSLHVVLAGVFAWKLLRLDRSVGAARAALRWALGFMFLSAAGPIALGPLAAADLRASPWYVMAIYFYLHFQYNGWFLFFLKALLFQRQHDTGDGTFQPDARRAVQWLATGCVLTLALSALWMNPPLWVHAVGVVGAAIQIVGCFYLIRSLRGRTRFLEVCVAKWLAGAAGAAFLVKHGLQFVAGWPWIAGLVTQRMVVIGFLHLVFLCVVTPMIMAWAADLTWLRLRGWAALGLTLLLLGVVVTELALFSQAVVAASTWINHVVSVYHALAIGGGVMLAGCLLLLVGFSRPLPERHSIAAADSR